MNILKFIWSRRTTVWGYVGVMLGVAATSTGIFGPGLLKYLIFGNGLVTALIGHYNQSVLNNQNPT